MHASNSRSRASRRGQSFLLSYLHQPYCSPYLGSREAPGHLAVTLEEGAHPHQILSAVLQAAIFRRLLNEPKPAAEGLSHTPANRTRQTASDGLLEDGQSKVRWVRDNADLEEKDVTFGSSFPLRLSTRLACM